MSHVAGGGHLKIYLGYAPGVGKTYQMLEDARALKARAWTWSLVLWSPTGATTFANSLRDYTLFP